MDPALRTLVETGDGDDQIEAIVRLTRQGAAVPPPAREITRFGDIRTVRLKRRNIVRLWSSPETASVKAPVMLHVEEDGFGGLFAPAPAASDAVYDRRDMAAAGLTETGRRVVLGVIDWGFDPAHPGFRTAEGRSRILALWDQRGGARPGAPKPYGYGQVFSRREIEAALASDAPYDALGYHPATADRGTGAHGTHVADIAGGSRLGDGYGGVAPEADLAFVHLSSGPLSGLADLGDSVRLLEAIDFLDNLAGDAPLVINLSMGRHGGSHTGRTLVERAFDRFLDRRPGRIICQSAGNYYMSRAHASGHLAPGRRERLDWICRPDDPTGNELEIWYPNRDRFGFALTPPGGGARLTADLGQALVIRDALGADAGRLVHRAYDPNTPDHHIVALLRRGAPAGTWTVELFGDYVIDGRFDAWTERDAAGRRGQSYFRNPDPAVTLGSICNGWLPIVVGAARIGAGGTAQPASFASAGPTRDGRRKPDLCAPGVRVLAARSAPQHGRDTAVRSRMSGASQATPFIAGLCALLLERGLRAGRLLSIHDIRNAVVGTARETERGDPTRLGAGLADPAAAAAAIDRLAGAAAEPPRRPRSAETSPTAVKGEF